MQNTCIVTNLNSESN